MQCLTSIQTMARPKVHPNNRKRATEACNFCRSSKKRCSATVPCTACLRRGIADTCFLTYQPRRASRQQPPEAQPQHVSTTIHVGGNNNKDNTVVGGEEASTSASVNLSQNNVESSQIACISQGQQSSPTLEPPYEPPFEHASTTCHASSSGSIISSNAVESHSRMLLNRRGDRGTCAWA